MTARELRRGERFRLKSHHIYPLEMSPRGGVPAAKVLRVEAGTIVVVAENCGLHIFDIPIRFVEESLNKHGNGQPFFALRPFLEEIQAGAGGL